jgi:hypothetical protein
MLEVSFRTLTTAFKYKEHIPRPWADRECTMSGSVAWIWPREEHTGVSEPMSQTFPGYSPPTLKQKRSYQHGSKSEQIPRYQLTFMCWYWVLHKMFKVLTICRNTSVETSHHGFPDPFQLERVKESMMRQMVSILNIFFLILNTSTWM